MAFCDSCFKPLSDHPEPVVDEEAGWDEAGSGDPWYRRIMGTTKFSGSDTRTWGQRLKDRGVKDLKHSAGLSGRSRVGLAAAAFAVVAGGAMAAGPLRDNIKDFVRPGSASRPYTVEVGGAISPGSDVGFLSDGSRETGLILPWPVTASTAKCQQSAGAGALLLTIESDSSIKALLITPSLDPADPRETPALWPGPRLITVLGDEGCLEFEMSKPTEANRINVESISSDTNTAVTIFIHERFESPQIRSNAAVVISELQVLVR